jgi:hypothetical protein
MTAEPIRERRRAVMRGEIVKLGSKISDVASWKAPVFKLIVFISSTFTDTVAERNILLDELFPDLRSEGRKYGIEVVFVDFRWGITDGRWNRHETWDDCRLGLEYCQRESSGLFFFSLQSSRYGSIFPAKIVDKIVFEAKVQELTIAGDEDGAIRAILSEWYSLDENAVPGRYILKNLEEGAESTYYDNWWMIANVLNRSFMDIPFWADNDRVLYGHSVTEWETQHALRETSDRERCYWAHRILLDENTITDRKFYDGFENDEVREKLDNHREFMVSAVPEDKKFEATISYEDCKSYKTDYETQASREYYDIYRETIGAYLRQELNTLKVRSDAWILDGEGFGMAGDDLAEILHHYEWAAAKIETFFGREALLKEAMTLLDSHSTEMISVESVVQCDLGHDCDTHDIADTLAVYDNKSPHCDHCEKLMFQGYQKFLW